MKKAGRTAMLMALILAAVVTMAAGDKPGKFSPYVDEKGSISLPGGYRSSWVHLGSWAVPSQRGPAAGFHDVYTQQESLKAYKKDGKWPDGAVLVKEIRTAEWDEMATGHVVFAGEPLLWFVMVKDTEGRFPGNPNWGEEWGWALFEPPDPVKNASTDYREDCLACHEPARSTDLVYVQGYPTLR